MTELKTCNAERTTFDYITIYSKDGDKLGVIQGGNPNEDWKLIQEGHDPIDEHWEDGNGNTCCIEGWM